MLFEYPRLNATVRLRYAGYETSNPQGHRNPRHAFELADAHIQLYVLLMLRAHLSLAPNSILLSLRSRLVAALQQIASASWLALASKYRGGQMERDA